MEETSLMLPSKPLLTPKHVLLIGYRRRRVLLISFAAIMSIALTAAIVLPGYESVMKIIVNRERLDPVVSSDNASIRYTQQLVTEEEMNSELELLRSEELLRNVVLACGLQEKQRASYFARLFRSGVATVEEVKVAKAIRSLQSGLELEALRKSNVIIVRYRAKDPRIAAAVLSTLSRLYLEKHTEVHTPRGQFEFFDQQAEHYRNELADAEARLAAFPKTSGTVAGQAERDLTIQKLSEMRVLLEQTHAAAAESRERITTLEQELKKTPDRITTVVRRADNGQLLMQLKSTLLTLELRHSELLQKFQPDYPPVQQVEKEIGEAKAAIAKAEQQPLLDQSTDRDPTFEWMRGELAKSRAELQALNARAVSLSRTITDFEEQAKKLNESSLVQQDLFRNVKAAEENYELYVRKREEARISKALDTNKILNVAIAQAPSVPALPTPSPIAYIASGLFAALVLSTLAAFTSEYVDQKLRTPEDVRRYLGVPVLASLPRSMPLQKNQLKA